MSRLAIPASLTLVACVLGAPTALAADDGVDGHSAIGVQQPAQEPTPSLSEVYGMEFVPIPLHALPPQDNEFFMTEDVILGNGNGPNPLRFAIPTPAGLELGSGEWIDVEGGRLWRTRIASANATTARLHLKGIDLPAGQQLRMSAPGWADSVIGPIEGVGEFGTGEAWSLSLPTAEVLLEWFVPNGSTAKQLPFADADYYHGYRQIWKLDEEGSDGGLAVGSCHLDPICFPTWSTESNGTIRLIFSGALCSGQLTATTALDETPYVTTANHCISTQSVANSCQFNFFYRRNTCAASATASAGTNISGGDLVVTYSASDCSLLMIRPTLPANVGWVGWTNNNVSTSTASTCLHHPDGSYQRISFGTKNATSFPCGSPQSNWSRLSWNSATQYGVTSIGVTEGGSSGSAIYRNTDRRMYGVLTCGSSSCTNTSADDGYGRLDVAISSGGFATPLAAGSDDAQEPNDSCAAPRVLANGTFTSLVVKRLDEDWYQLTSALGTVVTISSTYTHANGDVDMELFSACGGTALASDLGNVNNGSINYTNTSGSTTLFLRVFLGSDTRNDYSLTVSSSAPPAPANDECAAAIDITGSVAFSTVGATNSTTGSIPASCDDGAGTSMQRDIWYRIFAQCTGTATVSTCGATFDTRVAVYQGFTCPTASSIPVGCDDNTAGCAGNGSQVSWQANAGSVYYIRIGSPIAASGTGQLVYSCVEAPQCPSDLNGDGIVDGGDLGMLLGGWGTATGDLDNNGVVDGADLGIMLGAWGACP
ncbi:MAG: hypothetical protein FJ254_06085 [Phycisphaerae bacterium]|nr:hypothetical protein [Phycisphaerae bacterium]